VAGNCQSAGFEFLKQTRTQSRDGDPVPVGKMATTFILLDLVGAFR
jgi:hypothetical protein